MRLSAKLKTSLLTSLAVLTLATPMALVKPGGVIKTPESGTAKVYEPGEISPMMDEKLLFKADFDVTTHFQIKKVSVFPQVSMDLKLHLTRKLEV